MLDGSYAMDTINCKSLFENSGSYDLYRSVSYQQVDAHFNYWGFTTTGIMDFASNPKDIPRIYDYHDTTSYSLVNHAAWLSEVS